MLLAQSSVYTLNFLIYNIKKRFIYLIFVILRKMKILVIIDLNIHLNVGNKFPYPLVILKIFL